MGCGISTIDSFEEAKTKNELLTLVLKEKNVYSQRLLNEKLDKEKTNDDKHRTFAEMKGKKRNSPFLSKIKKKIIYIMILNKVK